MGYETQPMPVREREYLYSGFRKDLQPAGLSAIEQPCPAGGNEYLGRDHQFG
jgi:hypothetical protein